MGENGDMMKYKYNMELLEKLNEEYKDKPLAKEFLKYDHKSQLAYADQRIKNLEKLVNLNGVKILEIGCGGGYTSRRLAEQYECEVTGTDIYESPVWDELGKEKNLNYMVVDLSENNPFPQGTFDLIISYVAWEHIRHPFKVLQECVKILKPEGKIYIYANLYRSAMASHIYRTVYFPYPHLLFPDEVVVDYCLKNGVTQEWIDAFYYVNKLTYSEYKEYFKLLNFEILHEKLAKRKLDLEFYERFEEKLGLYPISDLELDFFEVILKPQDNAGEFKERQALVSYKIKADKPSPQNIHTVVRWSIEAFGADLEYAWYIYKGAERIGTIWYSKQNYYDWSATEAGTYQIRVFVRDNWGNIISELSEEFVIIG